MTHNSDDKSLSSGKKWHNEKQKEQSTPLFFQYTHIHTHTKYKVQIHTYAHGLIHWSVHILPLLYSIRKTLLTRLKHRASLVLYDVDYTVFIIYRTFFCTFLYFYILNIANSITRSWIWQFEAVLKWVLLLPGWAFTNIGYHFNSYHSSHYPVRGTCYFSSSLSTDVVAMWLNRK